MATTCIGTEILETLWNGQYGMSPQRGYSDALAIHGMRFCSDVQMLEIACPRATGHRMPVDLSAYLLSSSPPASSFELLSYAFHPDERFRQSAEEPKQQKQQNFQFHQSRNQTHLSERRKAPLKPIIIRSDSCEESSAASSGNTTPTSPRSVSPLSPGRLKKKVSFADHNGKALTTVRVMTETSDTPPRLRPEVLAFVTQGASAAVTEQPPLKLCFSQPASDYLEFRDSIERNFVSLENVILRDYNVGGTIKVKNISFEKSVFLRVTFDSWESFEDIGAQYVSGCGDHSVFDTFSFEFSVSTNFDMGKVIEFAVCFQTKDQQHWDSNNGDNYHIVSADYTKQEAHTCVTATPPQGNWTQPTQYACWKHVDTEAPYW